MTNQPLIVYLLLLIFYRLVELLVWRITGSTRRKAKPEWTAYLLITPFYLIVICPILEYLYSPRHPGILHQLSGGILFILSILIRSKAHLDIRKGFSIYIEKIENQELVTTGLYRYIRHPLYLGPLLLFLACPIFLASRFTWIFSLIGIAGIFIRLSIEEKFLMENMPGYGEYKSKTRALFPGIY